MRRHRRRPDRGGAGAGRGGREQRRVGVAEGRGDAARGRRPATHTERIRDPAGRARARPSRRRSIRLRRSRRPPRSVRRAGARAAAPRSARRRGCRGRGVPLVELKLEPAAAASVRAQSTKATPSSESDRGACSCARRAGGETAARARRSRERERGSAAAPRGWTKLSGGLQRGVELYKEARLRRRRWVEFRRALRSGATYKILYNLGQVSCQRRDYAGGGPLLPPVPGRRRRRDLCPNVRRRWPTEIKQSMSVRRSLEIQTSMTGRVLVDDMLMATTPAEPLTVKRWPAGRSNVVARGGEHGTRLVDVAGWGGRARVVSASRASGAAGRACGTCVAAPHRDVR